jgi:hypothetical protein
MRAPEQIRAEIAHWSQYVREQRGARPPVEAYSAVMILQTLAWVLGKIESPAVRVPRRLKINVINMLRNKASPTSASPSRPAE